MSNYAKKQPTLEQFVQTCSTALEQETDPIKRERIRNELRRTLELMKAIRQLRESA